MTRSLGSQRELERGQESLLPEVMAAFARPTRIVRGAAGAAAAPAAPVDPTLFEVTEEGALLDAFRAASGRVRSDMSVPTFLEVRGPLL